MIIINILSGPQQYSLIIRSQIIIRTKLAPSIINNNDPKLGINQPLGLFVSVVTELFTTRYIQQSGAMKGTQSWNKLKLASRFGRVTDDKREDQEPDKEVAFKIFPPPPPAHIFKTSKDSRCFPRDVMFTDSSVLGEMSVGPDISVAGKFLLVSDKDKNVGNHQPFAHSECNTLPKEGKRKITTEDFFYRF